MTISDKARLIEALLFLENEQISMVQLCSLSKMPEDDVKEALSELSESYFERNSGLVLREENNSWSFVPASDLNNRLKECYGKKGNKGLTRLSRSAVETLSIIAYSQPVTRREVTKIRGVGSDNIIKMLRERDFIKVVGRKSVPGNPCLYGTTRKFLYTFNLESLSDLPKLSEVDMMRFEKVDSYAEEN